METTVPVQVLYEFEGGQMGFFARGHHDPSAFVAGVAACQPTFGAVDPDDVRRGYWRNVPVLVAGAYVSLAVTAAGPGRGAYPVTFYDGPCSRVSGPVGRAAPDPGPPARP